MKSICVSLGIWLLSVGVHGAPLDDVPIGGSHLNVEAADFIGMGGQTTYLVIDFRQAGGGSYAFGYRHEGRDTPQMMLEALAAQEVLDVLLEDFSFGPAVRGVGYVREDISDVFPGAFSGPRSWVLWDGLYDGQSVTWSTSNVGINGVEFGNTDPTVFLPDGGFYGLSTSPDFPGSEPLVPLPGDFNSSGVVDGDDLLDLLVGFGTTSGPTLAAGDADRDGDVDRADVALWQENVGAQVLAPPPVTVIPEPGALVLVCLAVWAAAAARRCRPYAVAWSA